VEKLVATGRRSDGWKRFDQEWIDSRKNIGWRYGVGCEEVMWWVGNKE